MKCPICAQELEADAKFCSRCGKRIPRCPICGEVLYERSRFCANDGTPLPEELFADFPPEGGRAAARTSAVGTKVMEGGGRPVPRPAAHPAANRPEKPKPQPAPRREPAVASPKKKKSGVGVAVAIGILLLLLVAAIAGGTYYVLQNGLPSFFTGADASSSEDSSRDDAGDRSEEEREAAVQAALDTAEEYAAAGTYDRALETIQNALEEYPRSRELKDAQEGYEERYAGDILAQADQLMEEKRYDEARSRLDEGLALVPEHDGLLTKLEALEEAIAQESSVPPVSMSGIVSISATSWLSEPGLDLYHTPERTVDGDLSTAWVEGVDGHGIGELICFEFDQDYCVSGMKINAGYQKTAELYAMNNRPAMLTVIFSDGTEQIVQLQDINGIQDVPFYVPVETKSVSLVISSVYGGTTYEDTVISEILFY